MILIIAEKPSVAKDLAGVFSNSSKDGFIDCDGGKIFNDNVKITWAFGHLLKIGNKFPKIETTEQLPVFPEFFYEPDPGKVKQLRVIKKLISAASKIIIATDSGREGELIARLILNYCNWSKWSETFRFWTSEALTPDVILKTFNNLKPADQYDGLFYSAKGRQHADWIMGLNLSAATSKTAKGTYSIGRVQTPTLSLISDRMESIKNFNPLTYFSVDAEFTQNTSTYKGVLDLQGQQQDKEMTKEEADEIISKISSVNGNIELIQKKPKKTAPPLLHSLTSLQREANEKFSYSANTTLEIAQDLYEKLKAISYPRTDSNHMSESSVDLVIKVVEDLELKLDISPNQVGKRVFDDSKLTDHYAIIPLKKLPENATVPQRNIYSLILRKFHGVFLNTLIESQTLVHTRVNNLLFLSKGTEVVQLGWKELYLEDSKSKDKQDTLPSNLTESNVYVQKVYPQKHVTQPPKKHTEASLLGAMESLGLGTPATRAEIIEKLIAREFIIRDTDKKSLITTEKGTELISLVGERDFSNPELTTAWEDLLTKISTKNFSYQEFIKRIQEFTKTEISIVCSMKFSGVNTNFSKPATPKMLELAKKLAENHEVKQPIEKTFKAISEFIEKYIHSPVTIGKCKCGAEIKESNKSFYCGGECKLTVWKESYGRTFSKKEAQDLLNGKIIQVNGLKKKDPKAGSYGAKMSLTPEGKLFIHDFINK